MGRNHEKYVYAELAIPRHSAWYPLLLAEAEAKGLPIAQVALERLAASYLTNKQETRATVTAPVVSGQATPQRPEARFVSAAPFEDNADLEWSEERAASNALAFLDQNGAGFF